MIYDLSNELQAENFKYRCNLLFKKQCVVELSEKKPQRTLRQNSYLHAVLGFFGMQFGYKISEVKEWYFKQECNSDLFVRSKIDKITGKSQQVLRSTADLTTEEMTIAIERFRDWASQVAGVYIPSPEEYRLVEQMEREVLRGQMYL